MAALALTCVLALAACGKPQPLAAIARINGIAAKIVPHKFMWGVSTAGYQWEGQDKTSQWAKWDADGKTAERNTLGANGLVQYAEDADLTKGLGCNAFRTSIEWSRIEPKEGVYDPEAIAHYHRVLDALRARGLEPVITLMHFSYPAWLDADGGWESDKTPARFQRYAAFIAREYGSKIKFYMTFNEPNVYLLAGYVAGMMPPGKANPLAGLRAMKRMIKGHGLAYDALHAADPDAQVSFNMYTAEYVGGGPVTPSPEPSPTPALAGPAFSLGGEMGDTGLLPDPTTPEQAKKLLSSDTYLLDAVNAGGNKLDYAAIDYYCKFRVGIPFAFPRADTWEVYPEGLYQAIHRYHKRYKLPVLIAENGMATWDGAPRRDRWTRSAYMVQHILQVQRALSDGVPVIGYIHWSITDNYEWGSYSPRFGLFGVDARKQDFKRVQADGAGAFRQIIAARGITPEIALRYPSPGKPILPAPWNNGGTGTPVHTY